MPYGRGTGQGDMTMHALQKVRGLAVAAFTWLAMTAAAAPFAYVSFDRSTISVVDVATDTVVQRLTVGSGATSVGNNLNAVAVNLGGTFAYASCLGDSVVTVIDTSTNTVVANIPVDAGPRGVALNPAGTRLYVVNVLANTLNVIDTATNSMIARVAVTGPSGVVVDPTGASVYVASFNQNNVTVIDTATNTVRTSFPVGATAEGIAIDPSGTHLYVANFGGNSVSVVNPSTGVTTATIPVGGAWNVALNPSGTRLYVTTGGTAPISVIDTATNVVIATIPTGGSTYGVNVNPSDTEVYVTNPGLSALQIISTATNTVINSIPLGTNSQLFGVFIGGPVAAPAPAITLAPSSLTFASQAVGTTSALQTVTLTNNGPSSSLNLSSISVSGDFTAVSSCGTLAPGASCGIDVKFTPTAAGTRAGALTITSNASGSPHTVPLSGLGTSTPVATLTPGSLTFAARTLGTTSTTQAVTLANNGPGTLNIASITATGDFAFSSACATTLAQGATCAINVTFTPVAVGSRTGSLTIASNGAGSPQSVALTGTGQPLTIGVLDVAPTAITFDPQVLNTPSAPQLLVLHNSGTAPVNRGPESVDGDYKLLTGAEADAATSNTTCGATIAPGASCSLALVFTPTALGTRPGAISLPNDTATPVITVHLFGTGVNATVPRVLTVQPPILAFGDQAVGTQSASKTVTLTNASSSTATITDLSSSSHDFVISDSCTTLAPHASCDALVSFQPSAIGARTGSLFIRTFTEADPYIVQLGGNGVFSAIPQLGVSVTRIGFGNVLVGGAGISAVTLTNTGLVPVVLGTMSVLADFTIRSACPTTLDVGASCVVQIVFFPHALGAHAASVAISSNAANSPHHVDLSGTGCAIPTLPHARVKPVLCGP